MRSRDAMFSRMVADAVNNLSEVQQLLQEQLESEYPIDALVRVIHSQGEYLGRVIGHDWHGSRVGIKNLKTEKILYRWFREVELCLPK